MIRPFDVTNNEINLPEELNDILEASGLKDQTAQVNTSGNSKLNSARDIFNKKGASLETAAHTIASVMKNGETENSRLKASEMVLKVHGILNEMDDNKATQININIQGDGNKTLVNLVLPSA